MDNLLAEFMRDENCRLSLGDRWMVRSNGNWVVYARSYGQKKTRMLIQTQDLKEALAVLKEGVK
jgi:hypothetical protein